MPTYYTDEEIDALVNDVKQAFLAPAYQLAKSEGKQYPTAKEGGNGVQTQSEHGLVHESGERAETMKQGQPSKSGKGSPSLMSKAGPAESPESDPSASASPDASSAPSPDASSAPAPDASAPDAGGAPDMGGGGDMGGGPEQQNGPDELKQAYESLDDQSLQLHLQVLSGVLKERMGQGGPGGAPGGAPDASGAPMGAGAPPAPDMGAPAPAPAGPPAGAPPAGPDPMMQKSEKGWVKAEELAKAQSEIGKLNKGLQDVTEMLIKFTSQPKPKAITEISELSKSEVAPKVATRDQVDAKLMNKAKEPNLLKSDRTLIARYFTPNNKVKFEEIEHLLK